MARTLDARIRIVAVLLATLVAACGDGGESGPLADGRSLFGRMCASCHGNQGQGGIGPALFGVVDTFPACSDHIEWVTLGSVGWRDTHGDTYGAPAKPVNGGMPSFAAPLSGEEIANVVAFQRVRHGGSALEPTLVDCGVPGTGE
jgi:cytochrome c2